MRKRIITPITMVIVALICIILAAVTTYNLAGNQQPGKDPYQQAIDDAVVAEEAEVLDVIEIDDESNDVIWNDEGDKVLMMNFNKYPDSYPEGKEVEIQWGYTWVTSAKEFQDWYEDEEANDDWSLRIKQLLGMPESNENTHITAMWVSPEDMIRPAYVTDITEQMENSFDEENPEDAEFVDWFNDNAVYSYCENTYPWTRLGYTYDWADNGTEYGLSEFLVKDKSTVEVEFTKTVDEFIEWMNDAA